MGKLVGMAGPLCNLRTRGRFANRQILTAVGPVLLLLALLALAVLVPGNALAAPPFQDFTAADPNFPFVKYLAEKGLVKGYPDGTFRPLAPATRAEAAAFLVRALGLSPGPLPATPRFADLDPAHWAYQMVETAARAGIFKGFPDGTFRPDEPVTRAQAAALLLRLTRASASAVAIPSLEDLPREHWAAQAVTQALEAGLVHLAAPKKFAPEGPASRLVLARGLATMLVLRPESCRVPLAGELVPQKGETFLQKPDGSVTKVTAPTDVRTGDRVRTGAGALAEIRFPDGSGLRLDADTEVLVKEAQGRATILRDGSAGTLVDRLVLELPRGRIFGVLATRYLFPHSAAGVQARGLEAGPARAMAQPPYLWRTPDGSTSPLLVASASWVPLDNVLAREGAEVEEEVPWWKVAFVEKVRVKVNMPWGVAGIRGTFWMNEVTPARQSTSVLDGQAEVTAAGRTVVVESGQSTAITAPAAAPSPPATLGLEERQAWAEAKAWVEERSSEIQQKAPVVTPPVPVTQQAPPAEQLTAPPPPPPPPPVVQEVTATFSQVVAATPPAPTSVTPVPTGGGGGGGGGGAAPPADTTPPEVASTDPANGATNVPVDKTITVTFSEEVQEGPAYESIAVKDATGNAVAVSKSISGKVLTVTPGASLAYSTTYTVTVPAGAVKDAAGNALAQEFAFSFTTQAAPPAPADTTPPEVASTDPANGATNVPVDKTITVTFSEEVQEGPAYESIAVKDATGNAVAVSKSISGKVLTVTPGASLAYSTTYTVTVPAGAVKDAAGNALAAEYTFSFITAQPKEPPMPSIPAAYYGSVTINGSPAPVGTVVKAVIDGVEEGRITVTETGIYGDQSTGGNKLIVGASGKVEPGRIVTFLVDNVKANESVVFNPGNIKRVDLTVSVE